MCTNTDQKFAQKGQKNSTSVLTALNTFRISVGSFIEVIMLVMGLVCHLISEKCPEKYDSRRLSNYACHQSSVYSNIHAPH